MSLRIALMTVALAFPCCAAEPVVDAEDLPRFPATEPGDVLKTFRIKQGFRIELVAAEPLVIDPIAMCFDERGRLFVVEMRDYSERRDERLGRIKLLEDIDGDGRFDHATVFADALPWPTALFAYGSGLFVGCTPDILFFRDTDHDGVSDQKHVVFTGFGNTVQRLNVQALLNSFAWGLDSRIYGLTSFNGGLITSPLDPGMKPLDLRGRNFSFDPRIIERIGEPHGGRAEGAAFIRPESGGGQHGMSFDDFGRWFVCSNSAHLQMMMHDLRHANRSPHYSMPNPLADIAIDGPAAEVYRISPDEPWRVIRTKWRVAGLVGGPIEGGGRASGYFTGATGVTIYRGNAFPPAYRGNSFVGDAGGNLVHRKVINFEEHGKSLVQPVARRPEGEERVEFLASTDNWFRPVQFANAPDGCLYVADMYREVIEHPWSLPESIKKHLDLNSGNDRGRIYRIVPDGFEQPQPPRLDEADTALLVAMLECANGWHRDTAARLLYERQDKGAVEALRRLATTSGSPAGRVQALYAQAALGALTEPGVVRALDDVDGRVRERAVRLSETAISGGPSTALWPKLMRLTNDPDLRVRYQIAFTLGQVRGSREVDAQMDLVTKHHDERWIKAAVLSSLGDGAFDVFDALVGRPQVRSSAGGREMLRELVTIGVGRGEHGAIMKRLSDIDDAELEMTLAYPAIDAVQRRNETQAFEAEVAQLFNKAAATAHQRDAPEALRVAAIRLLGLRRFEAVGAALTSLLDQAEPQAVRLTAIGALDRFHEPAVAEELVKRWGTFTPRVRSEALAVLLRRGERALVLLTAIQGRAVRRGELSSNQVTFLRDHPDATVRELALHVLADTRSSTRQQVVEAYSPALGIQGDAAHGREVFRERCASCHRLGGEGHALGPDLVTVKASGKEKLLANILDPNREVQPNYLAYLVETKSGESHLGLIQSETEAGVTVRQAYGVEVVVPRGEVKRMKSQEQSPMPEGLEEGLTAEGLADLLEYISTAEGTG